MTTKKKTILKAIALHGTATLDDLVYTTVFERNNLRDNIKGTMKDGLCERIRDDVTGQPAYKLTPKGRAWLENDQDDSSGKPQAQVGKNSASKATGSHVVGGSSADLLPAGDAVAPPKPDRMPVEVSADEIRAAQRNADLEVRLDSAGRSIVEFCEWLAKKAKVRCPLNLHECKGVIADAMQQVSQLGYAVMEYSDSDIEKNILKLSEARDKAAIHSLRTGQKTAVFAIVDRVENVNVEWAA